MVACRNDNTQGSVSEAQYGINAVIANPEQFLPFIKDVIAIDSIALLKDLCHPDQSRIRFRNAYTLCNIRTDDMQEIDKFRHWFKNASVQGKIEQMGDTAWIPVELGDDERHPIIILERINEQWYFVGMEWKQ
jgi:hypothetical protein